MIMTFKRIQMDIKTFLLNDDRKTDRKPSVDKPRTTNVRQQPVKPKDKVDNKTEEQLDKATVNWWNSHSANAQKAWVKEYPDGKIALLVKNNKLVFGKRTDGSGPSGKVGKDGKIVGGEISPEEENKGVGTETGQEPESKLKKHLFSLDKHSPQLSDIKIEFSDNTKKLSQKHVKTIDDVLDKKYHRGKSKPGTFDHSAHTTAAKYAFKSIEDGEKDIDKIADMLHQGWSVAANEYKDQEPEKKMARVALSRIPYAKLPEEEKEKDREVAKALLRAYNTDAKEEKEKKEQGKATKIDGTPASKVIIINGKNKTLVKTKTSKTPLWTANNSQTTEQIMKNNKNYNGVDISVSGKTYKIPDFINKSDKFPKKYSQVIEAMMNTKTTAGGFEPPISYFIKGAAGAGRINAQAGELLTMMSVSMNDNDFDTFRKSMIDHIDETREKDAKDYVITKDWIKAAENNRKAILNRIGKQYKTKDPQSMVTNTSWDTKDEVEALGMTDYNKNKGYSTDIYIKVKDKDGSEYINEVSLKKDKNVNFLNSGTGKLREWDKNLPKDADMGEYGKTQKDMLTKLDKDNVEKMLSQTMTPETKEALEQMKKKKLTLDQVMTNPNRDKKKILKLIHTALAAHGDENSIKVLDDLKTHEKKYQAAVIRELADNEKVRNKMLDEIRGEFPLKGVLDKEETMAIGDMSVDHETVKEIFKTDKWEDIKEHLKSYKGPPPYIGYEVGTSKEIIPVAEIGIREDGTGYGGTWKFEMHVHKNFIKKLSEANKTIYTSSEIYESKLEEWILDMDGFILRRFKI
jgi:hypothetical protein